MRLDDVFEGLRVAETTPFDADAIYRAAMGRRAARVTPVALTAAAAFALVLGIGAGMTGGSPAAAQSPLLPLAHSPSTILLGS